jgi:hypothetical protein
LKRVLTRYLTPFHHKPKSSTKCILTWFEPGRLPSLLVVWRTEGREEKRREEVGDEEGRRRVVIVISL